MDPKFDFVTFLVIKLKERRECINIQMELIDRINQYGCCSQCYLNHINFKGFRYNYYGDCESCLDHTKKEENEEYKNKTLLKCASSIEENEKEYDKLLQEMKKWIYTLEY